MKGKRLLATMLALLLVVSLLPMTALAEDNSTDGMEISGDIDTNTGRNVTVTETGSIQTNEGHVYNNKGTVETNNVNCGVWNNNNTVKINEGYVGTNNGTVETNTDTGVVAGNVGTVKTNDGTVWTNHSSGTIETNNGTVGWINEEGQVVSDRGNYGTIETNNGTVLINQNIGTVETNNGTVEENYGTVETNAIDGVVDNCSKENEAPGGNGGAASSEKEPVVLEGKVENNFGTVVDKTSGDEKTYYGLSWGDNVQSLTLLKGDVAAQSTLNLNAEAAKASRSGYKMTGYKAFARKDGKDETITSDTTNYTMNAPVWLQILWEKITGKPAASTDSTPEAKPVKAAALPSTVAAEDVKVGTVVRVKGQLFRVIELDDGSMTVVTMGKLSKKDMEDLMAFLAKYFTPEQIELLLGDPELISGALAEELFGGNTGHIVFKAARNLFA